MTIFHLHFCPGNYQNHQHNHYIIMKNMPKIIIKIWHKSWHWSTSPSSSSCPTCSSSAPLSLSLAAASLSFLSWTCAAEKNYKIFQIFISKNAHPKRFHILLSQPDQCCTLKSLSDSSFTSDIHYILLLHFVFCFWKHQRHTSLCCL